MGGCIRILVLCYGYHASLLPTALGVWPQDPRRVHSGAARRRRHCAASLRPQLRPSSSLSRSVSEEDLGRLRRRHNNHRGVWTHSAWLGLPSIARGVHCRLRWGLVLFGREATFTVEGFLE